MKVIIQAYLEEAQWCNDGYVPTLEEHLKVSLLSCGYIFVTVASFVGMGEEVTKEAFDWIKTHPKFLMDSSLISRLINDIRSNEVKSMCIFIMSNDPLTWGPTNM